MTALFVQDAIVVPLGSGSRGNCTYVGDGRHGLLIDCGISTRQIHKRLHDVGLGDTRIDGVLVTHEHIDHTGACRILCNRVFKQRGRRLPFYMTRGTARALSDRIRPQNIQIIEAGRVFQAAGFTVEPYTVPHDTQDPCAFVVQVGGIRAGVLTDLGRSTRLVERQISSLDIGVIEFNHDVQMLMDGDYPWHLKQRIRGPHGHLSNAQAAELVARAASTRLKHLILAHLSEENNNPDYAYEAAQSGLHTSRAQGVHVEIAQQKIALDPMRMETSIDFRAPKPRPRRAAKVVATSQDDSHLQVSLFG